jgi:hypothetical protein
MVNHTPSTSTVHLDQLDARKRKSSPNDSVDVCIDMDPMQVDDDSACNQSRLVNVSPTLRQSRRRLSIDVAAAAATASCYRGAPPSSAGPSYSSDRPASTAPTFRSSSPSTSSNLSATSSRTAKCSRLSPLTHSLPPSPITPTERHRRKQRRKEQGARRRMARLYNKRQSPTHLRSFRFPDSGFLPNATAPSPAHFLAPPHTHADYAMSFDPPLSSSDVPIAYTSSTSSTSASPTPYSSAQFRRRASSPSVLQSTSGLGPSHSCLHQSCVAFRFASMIDGVQLSSLSPLRSSTTGQGRSSFYVPPILPPINRYTLQELDLDAIMKNPQLRMFFSCFTPFHFH